MSTSEEAAVTGYGSDTERLRDELTRIDLLLRRHLEAWWAEREAGDGRFRGLFVSDAEVDRLLATPGDRRDGSGLGRDAENGPLDRSIAHATERIDARATRTAPSTRLGQLSAEFDLDRGALDAFLLAIAPDLDRKYEKVYGYLQDDATRTRPSVGLAVRLLAEDDAAAIADRSRFRPGSTLIDEGLLELADTGGTFLGHPVTVPHRVADYVVGETELPATLRDVTTLVTVDSRAEVDAVPSVQQDRVDRIRDRFDGSDPPPMIALVGPDRATANRVLADILPPELSILRVAAEAIDPRDGGTRIDALRREVRLRQAVAHVRGLGELQNTPGDGPNGTAAIAELVAALDRVPAPVVLTGEAAVPPHLAPPLDRHALTVFEMPIPDRDRRKALWAEQPLPDGADAGRLADAFRLTRGEIEAAVQTVPAMSLNASDADALFAACRAQVGHRLDEHARQIDPTYTWDDIVLPPETATKLREAAAQVRHRGTVFDSWGFADRYSQGRGVTLLFTGPSGTGKTMAAEVIANDVGLPVYAIDLATMLSKYVGEVEENLRAVFAAAERANAILFFDEADALFGERSEVSDAHDRYANIEVDYLLQRLETHDGAVVLASNLAENIDDAFLRRVNMRVEFPHPDPAARTEIWEHAFPAATPTTAIDTEFLAGFELTGGNITNVAMAAAFLAADAEEPVAMEHVVRALRRELQKEGRLVDRDDFGEYRDHLRRQR